jgi:S-phase kinase-associated protein 1
MTSKVDNDCTGVDWNTHVVLTAKGGENFKLARKAIPLLGLIKNMTTDATEGEATKLPVEVEAGVIDNIIAYAEYHADAKAEPIPQPLTAKLETYLQEWDKQYMNERMILNGDEKQHKGMLEIMSAAHYFDCDDLLNFCCAATASLIQDKSPEQIRALFGLPDDFTPEQRARNAEELKALADL